MAQVALNIRRLSDTGVIKRANELKAGMEGNTILTTQDPPVAAFDALITAGEAAITQASVDAEKSKQSTLAKDKAIMAIINAAVQWGAQVQDKSKGDPAIIATFNMGVKRTPTTIGQLGQVQHLAVTAGDKVGELDLIWDPLHGATNFEIEMATGPTPTNWQLVASCRKSSKTLKGLTSGTQVWVRVRAKAPEDENDGDWSNPAVKFVP